MKRFIKGVAALFAALSYVGMAAAFIIAGLAPVGTSPAIGLRDTSTLSDNLLASGALVVGVAMVVTPIVRGICAAAPPPADIRPDWFD